MHVMGGGREAQRDLGRASCVDHYDVFIRTKVLEHFHGSFLCYFPVQRCSPNSQITSSGGAVTDLTMFPSCQLNRGHLSLDNIINKFIGLMTP